MRKFNESDQWNALRKRAEEYYAELPLVMEGKLDEQSSKKLIYELQVHRIESDMQMEELKKATQKAAVSATRYQELYDFAPSSYFTLSAKGEIKQCAFLERHFDSWKGSEEQIDDVTVIGIQL
jgi:hypothetical protein